MILFNHFLLKKHHPNKKYVMILVALLIFYKFQALL